MGGERRGEEIIWLKVMGAKGYKKGKENEGDSLWGRWVGGWVAMIINQR